MQFRSHPTQVHDVVVSVPTYFTDAERRALLDAARYRTHCVIVTLVMVYNVPSHLCSHLPLKTPRFGNVPLILTPLSDIFSQG